MKRAAVLVLVLSALIVFGCNAQRKPAPEPQAKLIPQESTIGFSQVDLNDAPASVQKVAAAMEDRPMYAWARDNNNSYILLNPDDDGEPVKVNKVVQRVPVQDFLWLDVYLEEAADTEDKKGDKSAKMMVFRLEDTDKSINGVGFEEMEEEDKAAAKEEEKPQAAPSPATPSPAPAPSAKTPVNQVKPAPPAPEVKQPQEQTPAENNGTNGQNEQVPLQIGN